MYQSALSSIEEKYQCSETTSWNIDEVISTIFLILTAESAAFLEEPIKKNPDLFGGDVKQFVQMGSEFSATEYLNAQRARNLIVKSVDKLFDKFDFPPQTFTWWDYRAGAFHRNIGYRIDHILGSKSVLDGCKSFTIDKETRHKSWCQKEPRTSDHAPVRVELSL